MSIYKSSTLAMIPTAYKDGKLYSVRPTDGSGDFTFSRGSNLAATRVASSGYIEKGRENLLLQSNQFDTTWTTFNASVTSGQSGYDGTSDAWELENTSSAISFISQSVAQSGVQTFSIYAKGGNVDWLRVNAIVSGTNANAYFDITNGTIGTSSGAEIDKTITAAGNGFYRISLSFNDTISQIRVQIADGDGDENTALGSNIYIQDAQLESGLVSTSVITTTTTSVSAGILEDMPRLDYSSGSCPSLLLEPQRTNLVVQSEYFGSYSKATSDATAVPVVTDNYAISPEGLQNAARVVVTKPSTDNDYAFIREAKTITKTSGDKMSQSVYLKATDASQIGKIVDVYAYDGSYLSVTNHTLTNEWERVEAIHTASVGTSNTEMVIGKARAYAGGTTLANMATDFLVYGHQFENGSSYPTSYIPTYGSAVTRGKDVADGAGDSSTFNDSEGVLFAEVSFARDKGQSSPFKVDRISLSDGTSNNRILLSNTTTANQIQAFIRNSSGTIFNETITLTDITANNKIALRYGSGNYALYINGTEEATGDSTNVPSGLNELMFDGSSGNYEFEGKVKQTIYFPTALTDSECIALTTL